MSQHSPLRTVLAVIVGVVTLVFSADASSAPATVGAWQGVSHVRRVANLNWVVEHVAIDCHFSFQVDGSGVVTGRATALYEGWLDDGKLRGYLAYMQSARGAALGVLPGVGSLIGVGANFRDVVGLNWSFTEGIPAREGSITGTAGSTLQIKWASAPSALRFATRRIFVTKEETASTGDAPAYSCWPVEASIKADATQTAAFVPAAQASVTRGKVVTTAMWSAYKVR
jgi:hypothetical protein